MWGPLQRTPHDVLIRLIYIRLILRWAYIITSIIY